MSQAQVTQPPKSSLLQTRSWLIVLLVASGLLLWNHSARIVQIDHTSNLAGGDEIVVDASSPTGYENGFRKLVVPQKNVDSIQWIMQVQKMFEDDTLLLRHVDYDNAPDGRSVRTASLYRWYLASIAWIHNMFTDDPIGISVERAALLADPILHFLTLILGSWLVARHFGNIPAAVYALGLVSIFPSTTAFVPGQPDESSLQLTFVVAALLSMMAGVFASFSDGKTASEKSSRRPFIVSGLFAGFALWIGPSGTLPVVLGLALSGAVLEYLRGRGASSGGPQLPWLAWATAGAGVSLLGWLIDRSPNFLEASAWQSDFTHPLYSVAWLGLGALLNLIGSNEEGKKKRVILTLALSVAPILALVYTVVFKGAVEGWSLHSVSTRLTRLPSDPNVHGLLAWLSQTNSKAMLLATILPLIAFIAALIHLFKSRTLCTANAIILTTAGPLLLLAVFGFSRLGWWNQFDAIAICFAAAFMGSKAAASIFKWISASLFALSMLLGLSFSYAGLSKAADNVVEPIDMESLIERHTAQWLARRGANPGEVALAPPNVTVNLVYYGNLRGLGTPFPENVEGFSTAVRLSAASTPDEAQALSEGREVSLIVHPSWDPFLEEYARLGSEHPENSFIALLNRWLAPRWLEPVTFQIPRVPGFENEWVTIFRVTEMQDNASAIGKLVEYFLDTGRFQLAAQAQGALASNFADEMITHITAAELSMARGDRSGLDRASREIVKSIEAGADFYLTWEARVRASLMLANAKRISETKTQLELCLEEATTDNLRRLSSSSLSNFLLLAEALKQEFPDPELKAYAVSLLPKQQQARFTK